MKTKSQNAKTNIEISVRIGIHLSEIYNYIKNIFQKLVEKLNFINDFKKCKK